MSRQSIPFHAPRGALVRRVRSVVLALGLLLPIAPQASAQEAICQTHDSLAKQLEEQYAERLVAAGLDAGGRLVELFASAASASWTMVMTTPAGESCVMAVGEHWQELKQPATGGPTA